jgi:glutamate racemase
MKLLIIDTNNGAQTIINSLKTVNNLDFNFVNLAISNLPIANKASIRDLTLKLLIKNLTLKNNYNVCIIMCISASSSILDILIKSHFIIANVLIIEPLIPLCLYIKKHKFRTLLILSTKITYKINWISRLLNSSTVSITYASLNLLESEIKNNVKVHDAINKLQNYKAFIAKCDGIVIGCSSYSLIKNVIAQELKLKYNFNGQLLDSSIITFDYFNKYCNK